VTTQPATHRAEAPSSPGSPSRSRGPGRFGDRRTGTRSASTDRGQAAGAHRRAEAASSSTAPCGGKSCVGFGAVLLSCDAGVSFDEGTSEPRSLKAPAAGTAPAGAFAFFDVASLPVARYAPAVLTRSPTPAPAGFIEPCLPTLSRTVPDGS